MTRPQSRLTFALLAGTMLSGSPASAVELPTGPSVAYGGVNVGRPSSSALAIQQSTSTAIVNWQGFSIGQGGRVDIAQPSASSALLNRVTGSTPSTIAGQLNANGQVYLVNPNGIAITKTGTVNAGGFVASTLQTSDDDFIAGRRKFRGSGASAAVTNEGRISIQPGGYAALLGGRVDQAGVISVPMGKVGLGAGEQATLDFSGDGFLQVAVPSTRDGSGAALILHGGRTTATGGRVEIQAATARDAARQAINLSGIVEARSVSGHSGAIVLGGGAGGGVTVSGRLDTSARNRTRHARANAVAPRAADGGAITVTGNAIHLTGARLLASGRNGGRIRVGGDAHGAGALQRAATTSVDAATTIRANSTGAGQGGSIVVWSDAQTDFAGRIFARGGPSGGDGGFAEVSGKALLNYAGLADLSAAKGRYGTLLLDPFNVAITTGATTGGSFTPGANDSVINNTDLQNALNLANVTVTTGGAGSPGAQAGDINVAASVAWSAPTTLTLSAFRNVSVVGTPTTETLITVPTGGFLVMRADNSGTGNGTVTLQPVLTVSTLGGGVVANAGSGVTIYYNPADNPPGGGVNATSYTAPANYAVASGPGGVSGPGGLNAFMLVNTAADLQNMRNNLTGLYALGTDIDASAAAGFNGGTGFSPVGATGTLFTGGFDGLDHTISNLTINRPAQDDVGLFGAAQAALLTNVTLANANVAGANNVGAFVGNAGRSANVTNVTVSGTVSGTSGVGGVAGVSSTNQVANAVSRAAVTGGDNTGGLIGFATTGVAVSASSASGPVNGANSTGGLIGSLADASTVTASNASGPVTGTDNVGGLIGAATDSSISTSFATGTAGGGSFIGGLIGSALDSTIAQTYATGAATGTDLVGGLIGALGGDGASVTTATLSQSFANGRATSQGIAGGLVGLVSNNTQISDSYATGLTSGGTAAGALIGDLNTVPGSPATALQSTVTNTYATGLVTGGGATGGLVGEVFGTLQTVGTSYWDTQTTGQATSAGALGIGQTTAQLQAGLPAGFAPAVWGQLAANSYPFLNWRYPTGILAVSGFTRDTAGAPVAGEPVRVASADPISYQTNSGANGYYYIATDPILGAQPQGATAYLDGANRGSSTTDAPTGAGAVAGLDVQYGRALVRTVQPNATGLAALLSTAGDSALSPNIPYTVDATGGVPTFAPGVALFVEALNPAGFAVDRSIVANGPVQIAGAGSAAPAGPLSIAPGQTIQSQTGDVVIATSQFTNNAGATGVQAAGRFLVYSADYAIDQRGGLVGSNLYNQTFASAPPSTVPPGASTFIYSRQPVLTFGATDATRQYAALGSLTYTPTVSGLVNGDTAAQSYSGAPSATDTTSVATGVGTYPGALQVTQGSLLSTIGYAFAFTNAALSITPAPLTVQANDRAKTYGDAVTFAGTEFTATGLRNTDLVTSTTLASAGAPATATVAGSPYAITASNAQGTGIGNYTITYLPGALTVNPAPLTVRANDLAKTYGDIFAFAGTEITATGLRNADQVTSATLTSAGAAATATVAGGPYAITASNAQGPGTGNYAITYLPGALSVNPAPLTIRADDLTKTFGTSLTFLGTEFTATGLRNADQVTSATLASDGAPAAAPVAGSPYAITVSNAQGAGLANYTIGYVPGALTVTAPPPPVVAPADLLTLALLGPTLDRQLPGFTPIYNPPDVIEIATTQEGSVGGGGSGGPTLGTGPGGPIIGEASNTLSFVENASTDLESSISSCDQRDNKRLKTYTDCVSTALDTYADRLDSRILQLPAPLRNVTAVIREAARKVRAARTITEARSAVRTAVAEVRKAIALIRADEPSLARLQVRQGNVIASALQSVDTRLSRAVGL